MHTVDIAYAVSGKPIPNDQHVTITTVNIFGDNTALDQTWIVRKSEMKGRGEEENICSEKVFLSIFFVTHFS